MTDEQLAKLAPYIYTAIAVSVVALFVGLAIWGILTS